MWECGSCGSYFFYADSANSGDMCSRCNATIQFLLTPIQPQNQYPFGSRQRPTGGPKVTPRANAGSIRIWWEPQIKAYRMTTPWNKELVELLKSQIPASDRSWDPSSKIWIFTEKWLDPIVQLCRRAFGFNPTVVTKEEAERAAVPPATAAMKLPSLHEKFFELVPFNAMKKAYQLAALELHPDRGGDATKMSELNAIWTKLEKEFYKI